ncbi:MAG TPA: hypothetical protein H9716_00760 [Candidatus Enterocloster faecavium]|uniref:Uncharacterized protein n=1 Tax=Candidatus Enterocloster faecavium TaxID=2838560 RepID=A0A9D2L5Q0_9FIRM|nr:hypothetical protein [Candidatus Enterocloster faecavium]
MSNKNNYSNDMENSRNCKDMDQKNCHRSGSQNASGNSSRNSSQNSSGTARNSSRNNSYDDSDY